MFLQVQLAYPVELPDEEDELAWEAAQRGPRGEVREERQDLTQRAGAELCLSSTEPSPLPPLASARSCAPALGDPSPDPGPGPGR